MEKQLFIDELKGSFNLRETKVDRATNIYFVFRYDGKQYKISTGVKVHPQYWDKINMIAFTNKKISNLDNYNNAIVNNTIKKYIHLFDECKKIIKNLSDKEIVDKEILMLITNYMKKKTTSKNATNPFVWFKTINRNDKNTKLSSKQTYDREIGLFEKFCTDNKLGIETFEQINYDLVKKYEKYLQSEGLKSNYKISVLLKFFNIAQDYNLMDNQSNHINRWKPIKERKEKDTIYLTESDIDKIYNVQIDDVKLEYSKDLFVLQCEIGQRYSDLTSFSNSVIEGNRASLIQMKTGNEVTVPLTERAQKILSKYNYKIEVISNASYNRNIKEIGKLAGLNENVKVRDENNKLIAVPKYTLITSHTARRSFATNALKKGMDMTLLMKLTGHKTISAFQKYIKANGDDAVNKFFELQNKEETNDVKQKENYKEHIITEIEKRILDIIDNNADIKGLFDDATSKEEVYKRLDMVVKFAPKDITNKVYIEFYQFTEKSKLFETITEAEKMFIMRMKQLNIANTVNNIEKINNELKKEYNTLDSMISE